jgi:hypothetical protein
MGGIDLVDLLDPSKFFSFLMFVMTLTETGGKEGAPLVTINADG